MFRGRRAAVLLTCVMGPALLQQACTRAWPETPSSVLSPSSNPPELASSELETPVASSSASALASGSAAPATSALPEVDTALSHTGRMLAGLVESEASLPKLDRALKQHRKACVGHVEAFDKSIGEPLASWAKTELGDQPGETVFYPFSGPDLLTAYKFFPAANRYVLVAVQDGGAPPDLSKIQTHEAEETLEMYERILGGFTRRGFFLTAAMGKGYGGSATPRGITGVLMMFAELAGLQVLDVLPVRVKADGSDLEVHPGDRKDPATWASVRLELRRRSDGAKVLVDYANINLANIALSANEPATRWMASMAKGRVLVKAASHLMQQPDFFTIRDLLLENAKVIVQDETGIAYKQLAGKFDVDLYGDFKAVNVLFDNGPQRALREAYEKRTDVKPLTFNIGYRKGGKSCLQVGRKH
ncbi:MAG: hypothetical protein U0165_18460 [Polyangiaceae bacterium]